MLRIRNGWRFCPAFGFVPESPDSVTVPPVFRKFLPNPFIPSARCQHAIMMSDVKHQVMGEIFRLFRRAPGPPEHPVHVGSHHRTRMIE
jgi:hypothetical protein